MVFLESATRQVVGARQLGLPLLPLLLCLLLSLLPFPVQAVDGLAYRVAVELADQGPRPTGSAAAGEAEAYLLHAMQSAGLEEVAVEDVDGARNLVGVLRGRSAEEVVLSAHYDTVAASPGAGDDASGCGVVLATARALSGFPREHTLRVVLFDAEEDGLRGSRAWIGRRTAEERERILAMINLEMVGWSESSGAVAHTFQVEREDGEQVVSPAWLVHAVLEASRAIRWPVFVADPQVSIPAQFAVRSVQLRHASDADALLEAGVPSILLADSSLLAFDPAYHSAADVPERLDSERLDRWVDLATATVRRLDALPGRPVDDDQYLAIGQRVVHRRQLLWVGFVLWCLLVFRGVPGAWKNTDGETRRARGRLYFARLGFRFAFLFALFLYPVLSVLLFPAALVILVRSIPRQPRLPSAGIRAALVLIGWLPVLVWGGVLMLAWNRGFVRSLAVGGLPMALVLGALVAFTWMVRGELPRRSVDAPADGG